MNSATTLAEDNAWLDEEMICATGISAAIGLIAFVSNALLLLALAKKQLLKENKLFVLLLALCGADMLCGLGVFMSAIRKLLACLFPVVIPKRIVLEMAIYDFFAVTGEATQQTVTLTIAVDRLYAVFWFRRYANSSTHMGFYLAAFAVAVGVLQVCLGFLDVNRNMFWVDPLGALSPITYMSYNFPSMFIFCFQRLQMTICFTTTAIYTTLLIKLIARSIISHSKVVYLQFLGCCFGKTIAVVSDLIPAPYNNNASVKMIQKERNKKITQLLVWLITAYVCTVSVGNAALCAIQDASTTTLLRVGAWAFVVKALSTSTNLFIYAWRNGDIRVAVIDQYYPIVRLLQRALKTTFRDNNTNDNY